MLVMLVVASARKAGLWIVGLLLVTALSAAYAQSSSGHHQAEPNKLPAELATDSYAIYSALLPSREVEWGDVPRTFWLVEDTTTPEPMDSTCSTGGEMNPHEAVKAPQAQRKSFDEVLADFDIRCHERFQLESSRFHSKLPVKLVDGDGQKRYSKQVSGYLLPSKSSVMEAPATPEEFKGAAGMHSFSAVYFNKAHTMAMTRIGIYCGPLCGNWRWVVLQRTGSEWHTLPWVLMEMGS